MSQTQAVLTFLIAHKSITGVEAWRHLGIYRLGARIYDLRKKGHKIETVDLKPAQFGSPAKYVLLEAA